jgi:hypothetical protein
MAHGGEPRSYRLCVSPTHKAGVLIGEQINPQTVHDLVTE